MTYPGSKAVIAYSYDDASHLTRVESLWGTGADVVFYQASGFNELHQETTVSFGNGRATQYEYYEYTRRLKRTLTTGGSTIQDVSYTYDKASNITGVTDAAHTGAQSCSLSNIVYDDLHRLTSLYSTAEAKTLTYEYTALGNINKNGEMGTGTYTYSPTQPHAVTAANGSSYSYDTAGNMITRNRNGQPGQTLTYDEQNRLTQVVIADGPPATTVQFGYSAGGGRLWKKVNGQVTQVWIGSLYEEKNGKILCHVYAGDRLVASFEPAGGFACLVEHDRFFAALWHFGGKTLSALFGNGHTPVTIMWAAALTGIALGLRYNRRRLRDRYDLQTYYGLPAFGGTDPWRQMVLLTMAAAVFLSSNPQAVYAGTAVYDPVFYYYHPDHLGSSQLMTDRDGDVVQQYGYSPFGREDYKNNTLAFSVSDRYTGQTLDEETGLYYYGARYYDPELARFIQADTTIPDPEFSQAYNRYAYCLNNPLKFTDPTGQEPITICALIIAAIQGAIVGGVLGAVVAAVTGGDIGKGFISGAISGAVAAIGVGAGIASKFGSSWGEALRNVAAKVIDSAVQGTLTALATGENVGKAALNSLADGLGKGLTKELINTDFITDPTWRNIDAEFVRQVALASGIQGLVGGVKAEIGGGEFMQGFAQGAQEGAGDTAGELFSKRVKANWTYSDAEDPHAWNPYPLRGYGGIVAPAANAVAGAGVWLAQCKLLPIRYFYTYTSKTWPQGGLYKRGSGGGPSYHYNVLKFAEGVGKGMLKGMGNAALRNGPDLLRSQNPDWQSFVSHGLAQGAGEGVKKELGKMKDNMLYTVRHPPHQ